MRACPWSLTEADAWRHPRGDRRRVFLPILVLATGATNTRPRRVRPTDQLTSLPATCGDSGRNAPPIFRRAAWHTSTADAGRVAEMALSCDGANHELIPGEICLFRLWRANSSRCDPGQNRLFATSRAVADEQSASSRGASDTDTSIFSISTATADVASTSGNGTWSGFRQGIVAVFQFSSTPANSAAGHRRQRGRRRGADIRRLDGIGTPQP